MDVMPAEGRTSKYPHKADDRRNMSISSIALSGMNAASLRLANSANNIANVQSTSKNVGAESVREPYTPTDVIPSSLEPGGVRSNLQPRDPATTPVFAPDNPYADADGIVQYPNVSLEKELVETKIASYDYKANLKVIKAEGDMMQLLLDIET